MDTLRIILIACGILLIVGIYLWDRLQSRRRKGPGPWQDLEFSRRDGQPDPLLGEENPFEGGWRLDTIQARREGLANEGDLDELRGIIALSDEDVVAEGEGAFARNESAVVILSLMAGEGRLFNGLQLLDAMEVCGLSFGAMGIFHYYDLESGKSLFSVANVLEPGSFDRDHLDALETPGLALFMPLPAPLDGERALLTFVQQAKRLKEQLDGVLTDGQRRELTRDTLEELKVMARRYREPAE